jgi:uncharacterized membrane protein
MKGKTRRKMPKHIFCHRIPERTFKIMGRYFPVCSRCTGIIVGAFSSLVTINFIFSSYDLYIFLSGILMFIPAFIDGTTQLMGWRVSNNTLRFLTGFMAGFGVGIISKEIDLFIGYVSFLGL